MMNKFVVVATIIGTCVGQDPGMTGDCNADMAVCVASDLALLDGADFESLTPGCRCCFMSVNGGMISELCCSNARIPRPKIPVYQLPASPS